MPASASSLPGEAPAAPSTPPPSGTHQRTQSSISPFVSNASMTPAKQNKIDEKLAILIAQDFQPFSIVEDSGFRGYAQALNPSYVPPSRKTLSKKILPRLYEREYSALKERVKKATEVCLTTDCWTARTTTSFMSVTCHFIEDYKMVACLLDCFEFSDRHTSENLADELKRVVNEWDIESKVVCCVTDNAANITKAIRLLKWTHHPCLAHTINLVVRDALKVVKLTIDKVKVIVEYFHKSTTATEKLKSTQHQMNIPEQRLKQDCITRWNSTFYMLKLLFLNAKMPSSRPWQSSLHLLEHSVWRNGKFFRRCAPFWSPLSK